MLSDYKRYLLKIRNNLIRCGVELEVKDVEDYDEVFYLGEKLSDLLWFYSILEISGSEDKLRGFMLPLNSFYKNSLRDKYFEDYLVYRAEYMKISASDTLLRDRLEKANTGKVEEIKVQNSTVSFLQSIKSQEVEDDFISYEEEEEVIEDTDFGNWGGSLEDEDDDFISYDENEGEWGSDDTSLQDTNTEDIEEVSLDDDEFVSYGATDNYEEEEFSNWGSNDDNYEEDEFSSWGSEEEEDEFTNWGDVGDKEDEEEEFSNWGSSEDEDSFSTWGNQEDEEDEFTNWGSSDSSEDLENDEEDTFSSWGSSEDEEDSFESWGNSNEEDNEEDAFDNWGSSEESEEDDFSSWGNNEEEEDAFDTWGSSNDEEEFDDSEEDSFGNWGSSDESDTDLEEDDGSDFGSWGQSSNTSNTTNNTSKNDNSPKAKKSKLDYEIESNEKTAMVIEKIASGIFSKSSFLKSKVSEKLKNLGENQD